LANESNRGIGNCSFIVTSQWICVYDSSQNVEAAEELIALVRSVSALPIRFLVNSQYRGHHTHGNQSFLKSGTGIISTRQTRIDMHNKDLPQLQRYQQVLPESIDRLKKDIRTTPPGPPLDELNQELERREKILVQLNSLQLILPEISFDSSLSLHDGEQEILALYPGKGNTAGDAVLWLADQRILFAGDLVAGAMIPDLEDSFTKEWIETLLVLEKMKPEIVVPTLGSIGSENLLVETRHYLMELRKTVKQYFDRGDTLDSVLQNCPLPAKYKTYQDTDYYPNNVEKVYRELQAEEASMAKPAPTSKQT
jgi:cyclase